MRDIDRLLDDYSRSHRHPVNRVIHQIALPLAFWAFLGLLRWSHPYVSTAFIGAALIYYARLSLPMAAVMAGWFVVICGSLRWFPDASSLPLLIGVLLLAWIAQIVGHEFEGTQPSFLKRRSALLIGPAWAFVPLLRRVGIVY